MKLICVIIYITYLISSLLYYGKARADIQEVHFLPFNPTDKRTALTYIDSEGKMHRVSKGAPEQVSGLSSYMKIIPLIYLILL